MVSVYDCKIKILEDQVCYAGVVNKTWGEWKCVLLGASFHHVYMSGVTTCNVAPRKEEGKVQSLTELMHVRDYTTSFACSHLLHLTSNYSLGILSKECIQPPS